MGLFDFISSAGENKVTEKVEVSQDRLNELRQQNISKKIASLGLAGGPVLVLVDGEVATLTGSARSEFYTGKSGDALGKIAKQFFGNSARYPLIFEANKPMLSDPDKIYPGQSLRIPPL